MKPRSNDPIFGAVAPSYYERQIPVIPLHYHDKRPIPSDWSRFAEQLPTPDEQQKWVQHYSNCNVGLVLGRQAGVCMVDIDTPDEDMTRTILEVLEAAGGGRLSPWQRIGKKGMVLAYRWNNQSTFRIKDVGGSTLVEFLSTRTQVVLPPSIHPETKQPYSANGELLDVIDSLPTLDDQVESMLRGALEDSGVELSHSGWTRVTDFTASGARDVKMTQVAGFYANGVVRGELPFLEACDRLRAWHSTCMEKVAGDDVDIEKGIQNLARFLLRDVIDRGKVLPQGWDEGLDEDDKAALGLKFDNDHEEWSYGALKDHLQDNFERHEQGSPARMSAVEYVLKKISQSTSLSRLDQDRLLRYMSEASGEALPITTLRARIRELASGDLKGQDHTEIARAVIEDLEQVAPLRYHNERFWTWGGSHWQVKPEADILRHVAAEYGGLDAARRFNDHRGILRTMASLLPQGLASVHVKGVNFANGVLTKDLQLKKHDPSYGFTYTLPFRYMPDQAGHAPKFNEFMYQAWGEDEDYRQKVNALQEAMCVTIFGMGPSLQRAILLHGPPKTGKSTMLTIVESLVPEEARTTCPPNTWSDRFEPTTMNEKIINVCGELSDKKPIDGQMFKSIVDGEEMLGQYKGGQIFHFEPICTHWFASNHLPRTDDTSSAFNRRWMVLTFSKPVKTGNRQLNYGKTVVAEEREAIAAWAVQAMTRLMENNEYTLPQSHWDLMEEVANVNNSVRYFMKESGRVKVVGTAALQDGEKTSPHTSEMALHNEYWAFCLGAGAVRPVGPKAFRQKMRELAAEMDFKPRMRNTDLGTQEYVYDGVTLVKGRQAA